MEVRNRFKGLDLIDRVPDELRNEVSDTVQETGIKTIPMEKKCKKQNGCLRGLTNSCENKEPIIQSEVSQKEKHKYSILTHIYGILKDGNNDPVCETAKETQTKLKNRLL